MTNAASFLFGRAHATCEPDTPEERAAKERAKQQWLASHTPTKLPPAFAWFVQPSPPGPEPKTAHRFRGFAKLQPTVLAK